MSNDRAKLAQAIRDTFVLARHEMSEEPESAAQGVGYVRLPGSAVLKVAQWRGGEWVDEKRRPFHAVPDCWYSVEVRK